MQATEVLELLLRKGKPPVTSSGMTETANVASWYDTFQTSGCWEDLVY